MHCFYPTDTKTVNLIGKFDMTESSCFLSWSMTLRKLFYSTGPTSPPIQDKGLHHVYFSESVLDAFHDGPVGSISQPSMTPYHGQSHSTSMAKFTCREKIKDEFVIHDSVKLVLRKSETGGSLLEKRLILLSGILMVLLTK